MDFTTQIPVDYILKAASWVKKIAYTIAVIGAVTSFGTQVGLLESWKISFAFAIGIAATIDLLAVCAMVALQVPGFPWKGRVGLIFVFTLSVSMAANIIAGSKESNGAAVAHAWPVLAYMFAELIANLLRKYVAIVQARRVQDTPKPVETESPVHATAVVGTTPATAITAKPGTAKARILELAAVKPPLSPEDIATKVGTKPGWVKHVVKTAAQD